MTGRRVADRPALIVLEPGPLTLVQDAGRPGHGAIGVGPSGAVDRGALGLANRLLGNDAHAAALEITVGGFSARIGVDGWIAVTGARGALTLDGQPMAPDVAIPVTAGTILVVPPAERGLRYYLAVRGGLDVARSLGSASRDTLSGIGPAPLAAGDELRAGVGAGEMPHVDTLTLAAPETGTVTVALTPGPRADWFTPASLERLFDQEWIVSARSNRIGATLEGSPLDRVDVAGARELPSEGVVAGSIQVPPSGLPTVLLADHPVTGGYPVIAVVADASLDAFGQLRPGQRLRFRHAR